ncbi:MAG TPA: GNAT family N-acetyltransferase [Longimicrobium sp.]|nr:GNAT family N-acetyltransferase [Longimicrobium sp.]
MEIRSLGYRTDLIFPRFEGIVADRGDCTVVRTPSNPGFYWGNFLLFAHPPDADSLPVWKRRFREEIASVQPAPHLAFGWDSPGGEAGAVEPFLAEGFILSENAVLTADTVLPPRRRNADVEIRPLATDGEWAQALENHVVLRGGEFPEAEYRPFKAQQLARYRRMTDAGLGTWFGAFADGRLVADLGVFTDGTLARFQQVGTHPDFRNRGICGTLVYESARYAQARLGVERFVMTADEHYHAGRIYESLGFRRTERQLGLELRPRAGDPVT